MIIVLKLVNLQEINFYLLFCDRSTFSLPFMKNLKSFHSLTDWSYYLWFKHNKQQKMSKKDHFNPPIQLVSA